MGSFIDITHVTYGVMDQHIRSHEWCTNKAIAPKLLTEKLYNCSNLVDDNNIRTQITDKCKGKNSCDLDVKNWWNPSLLNATTTTYVTDTTGAGKCNDNAFFFV